MHDIFGSESDYTKMAMNPDPADDSLNVRFYVRSVENKLKSWGGEVEEEVLGPDGAITVVRKRMKGAGYPIFEPVEYCEIKSPGEAKHTVLDAPVLRRRGEYLKRRFARQYAAFKRGETARAVGLPLSEWPGCNRAEAENLAQKDIHTVEQLAALSDAAISGIGPIQGLKQRAKDYLEKAKGQAPLTEMRAAMAQKDAQIAAMQAQIQALAERMAQKPAMADDDAEAVAGPVVQAAPAQVATKKRGRPKKVAEPVVP